MELGAACGERAADAVRAAGGDARLCDADCEGTILKSLEDPETTKENPEIHGYGIKGIRLAVEKYEGHMTIKQENNWFIVSILIPIPEKQNQTAL